MNVHRINWRYFNKSKMKKSHNNTTTKNQPTKEYAKQLKFYCLF